MTLPNIKSLGLLASTASIAAFFINCAILAIKISSSQFQIHKVRILRIRMSDLFN